MKYSAPPVGPRTSLGLTLIEMMVSLAIGLVVAVGVLSAYMGSASAGKVTQAQVRMNEDAHAALAILSQHLRMTGNNPEQGNRLEATLRNPIYWPSTVPATFIPSSSNLTTTFAVRGCDGTFTDIVSAAKPDELTCTAASNSRRPDSIAVTYEADRYNTVPASGQPTDCLGNALTTQTVNLTASAGQLDVGYHVADNRFYIDRVGGIQSLYCKGNGGNSRPQPLVENIEDLQFLYGTVHADEETNKASIAGYLTAAEVRTHPELGALSEEQRWTKVKAIRICVVVRSENPVASDIASARYLRCDGKTEENPPDLRLRRAYSKTVLLRNRE